MKKITIIVLALFLLTSNLTIKAEVSENTQQLADGLSSFTEILGEDTSKRRNLWLISLIEALQSGENNKVTQISKKLGLIEDRQEQRILNHIIKSEQLTTGEKYQELVKSLPGLGLTELSSEEISNLTKFTHYATNGKSGKKARKKASLITSYIVNPEESSKKQEKFVERFYTKQNDEFTEMLEESSSVEEVVAIAEENTIEEETVIEETETQDDSSIVDTTVGTSIPNSNSNNDSNVSSENTSSNNDSNIQSEDETYDDDSNAEDQNDVSNNSVDNSSESNNNENSNNDSDINNNEADTNSDNNTANNQDDDTLTPRQEWLLTKLGSFNQGGRSLSFSLFVEALNQQAMNDSTYSYTTESQFLYEISFECVGSSKQECLNNIKSQDILRYIHRRGIYQDLANNSSPEEVYSESWEARNYTFQVKDGYTDPSGFPAYFEGFIPSDAGYWAERGTIFHIPNITGDESINVFSFARERNDPGFGAGHEKGECIYNYNPNVFYPAEYTVSGNWNPAIIDLYNNTSSAEETAQIIYIDGYQKTLHEIQGEAFYEGIHRVDTITINELLDIFYVY